jgi:hypothetical protein
MLDVSSIYNKQQLSKTIRESFHSGKILEIGDIIRKYETISDLKSQL